MGAQPELLAAWWRGACAAPAFDRHLMSMQAMLMGTCVHVLVQVLTGEIPGDVLVDLSAEELASNEQRAKNDQVGAHTQTRCVHSSPRLCRQHLPCKAGARVMGGVRLRLCMGACSACAYQTMIGGACAGWPTQLALALPCTSLWFVFTRKLV